jgi:NAD(P)-dependent dehydrogenase (short-subunit alcohol dehydrogenase family)
MTDQTELLESVAEEIRKKGRRAVTFCGDVSEEEDVKALVDKATEELGGVDVVSSTIDTTFPISVVLIDADT